ncbi:hypothetical protein CMI40_00030 [Candidatus Pacearchaeota archaeon]|jgi:ABC-type antimicrobial peptide transport system permease subunit|nr:hypothetical protein [Candidatus Pacearchaeota archaeon]|tara:strand:+ start:9228 stop:9422 length:195 start_codon:yes stop_codon:yes gene_type:complete
MAYDLTTVNLPESVQGAIGGGILGVIIGIGIMFLLIVSLAIYIYHSFAWMTIAKKLKYKRSWLA